MIFKFLDCISCQKKKNIHTNLEFIITEFRLNLILFAYISIFSCILQGSNRREWFNDLVLDSPLITLAMLHYIRGWVGGGGVGGPGWVHLFNI